MDFEQFKWGAVCVGMGGCLAHLLFYGRSPWRYRIVCNQVVGWQTEWWAQRRLVLWPFWSNLHYHSATGHDWTPTAYSSEDDAIRSLPRGCGFEVVRKGARSL